MTVDFFHPEAWVCLSSTNFYARPKDSGPGGGPGSNLRLPEALAQW